MDLANHKTIEEDGKKSFVVSEEWVKEMIRDAKFLECLYAAGVDNWEGYDAAIDMMDD